MEPLSGDPAASSPLLAVRDLEVVFHTGGRTVRPVRGVSFEVHRGETVGLVGESGSGKSVTALSVMRLLPDPPARITGGRVELEGGDLLPLTEREMRGIRGGRVAMVFQDPFSSLNPTMTLGAQVVEAIRAHSRMPAGEARRRAVELLASVRIPAPEMRMRQYPHQVSGGQRQRVMIAMAFAGDPALLIADEPTTALDVTVQAQVLDLMSEFRGRANAAVLLITHDMAVVAQMCDRILVMYAGQIVESGPAADVLRSPRHPYSQGLLASLPRLHAERTARLAAIPGAPPDLAALPPGCPFAPRCGRAVAVCTESEPGPTIVEPGRVVRCHLAAG